VKKVLGKNSRNIMALYNGGSLPAGGPTSGLRRGRGGQEVAGEALTDSLAPTYVGQATPIGERYEKSSSS
jgi:hypothetical protein